MDRSTHTVQHGMFFARQGWYPAERRACEALIDEFLSAVDETALPPALPGGAGIVPHAGWAFSGRLAAQVFWALSQQQAPDEAVETVVLFGGHLGPRSASWLITSGSWPTPVGEVEVDAELSEALAASTDLSPIEAHDYEPDNTIELQMPLVRQLFPNRRLVVAGVPADAAAVAVGRAAVTQARRLGRRVVVVGSTDLTHYGPNYGFMPHGRGPEAVRWVKEENDRRAVELMSGLEAETLRKESLEGHLVCCPGAACAALGAAQKAGARAGHVLERFTSYDLRPADSFVGYASVVF